MTDDDPFDRLGADDDREGDPFERLGPVDDAVDGDTDAEDASDEAVEESTDRDPWSPPGEDQRDDSPDDGWQAPGSSRDESAGETSAVEPAESTNTAPDSASGGDDGDPFHGVSTPEGSPFDAGGPSVFERVDVGGSDPDQVWESITGDDDDDPAPMPEEGRYSEVSKHSYCEGCEHFSPPPDVTCTHESAEIIEFLDMETVRLLDCPVVAEREALERGE